MKRLKAGVLGSGDVGKVLAGGLVALGHDVMIGSRTPEKLREWAATSRVSTGTFEEAARFGDLLVLATLGVATENVITLAGPGHFAGKPVIDATNPLDFSSGAPRLSIGHDESLGEQIQKWIPEAHVVKAFNSVGNAHMIHPEFPGGPPDMFLCGNDEGAKRTVSELCRELGWGVLDLGGIEASRYLEPLCMIWVLHGLRSGSWNHAFKMLTK